MRISLLMVVIWSAVGLSACRNGGNQSASAVTMPVAPAIKLSLAAQVGEKIFFDPSLSGSGKMSCATCHDPNFAYGPPNGLAVQLGGPNLADAGFRAIPSLRYKQNTPAYADLLDNPDGISAPGPGGGFASDGRANTLAEQAKIPLLDSHEMANASASNVVAKIQASPYADLFRQAFGSNALANIDTAFNDAAHALQAYQFDDVSFHPFSSKYDLYAGNKIGGTLTPAETRGMTVFANPKTGNCASCHYQGAGLNGSVALFTDFSYEAISVPRNPAIPANNDQTYYDMGLCGPLRTDHLPTAPGAANRFCGMFKTPTLRNVATRKTFFHNGVMHSLEQVIRFYNTRDTMPEIWYPTMGGIAQKSNASTFPTYGLITTQYTSGVIQKFNDLPIAYRPNLDLQLPLDGRARGSAPPMSEQNIADLVCFLDTLTDGYKPPAIPQTTGSCVN
jgi:cytochrome c peroxidase